MRCYFLNFLIILLILINSGCNKSVSPNNFGGSKINTTKSSKHIINERINNCNNKSINYNPIVKRLANNVNENWGNNAIKNIDINKIGNRNVTVALIDSGVNIENNHILKGKNLIDNNSITLDRLGHGTNVAKIIIGTNNKVKILPIKIYDSTGKTSKELVVKALNYAIKKRVDLINVSLGFYDKDNELEKAINNAYKLNIPIIASSGNMGLNVLSYPAYYNYTFSVIARDVNNVDTDFSNKSLCKRSFSAPGVHIKVDKNKYVSGTSYAAAFVTGAISEVKLEFPSVDTNEIFYALKKTSTDGNEASYGLINIKKLINYISKNS